MKLSLLALVASLLSVSFAASAKPDSARVKIGLLDGEPVYHWRAFKSCYTNDIDRALILRDFKRHGLVIPTTFVDEAFQREVAQNGDRARLERGIQAAGLTISTYRQFLREEIILRACPVSVGSRSKGGDSPAAQARWLASLRQGARIKLLR